jgi:hypothetical protein
VIGFVEGGGERVFAIVLGKALRSVRRVVGTLGLILP